MSLIPKYNHLVYSQYPAAVKLSYQDAVNLQVIQVNINKFHAKAPVFVFFLNSQNLLLLFSIEYDIP